MKRRARRRVLQGGMALAVASRLAVAPAAEPSLLELEAKIRPPEVRGRIDQTDHGTSAASVSVFRPAN
jgi:hypothetical protein